MNGLIAVCLCIIATVSAQGGDYSDRRDRRVRLPGVIDPGFHSGARIPGVIDHGGVIGSGVIDRGFDRGVIGSGVSHHGSRAGNCFRGEVPSYDRRTNRIEWCSYRYRFCNDPRAQCRLGGGSTGTCCRPRTHIGGGHQYCRGTGIMGQGTCYRQRDCRRQFGRRYECQFNRGSYGTCCLRYSSGIRY